MTLDNMMTMAKADRYTDEGKKEIQDAKRYKPGEISEATGLQKQTDGSWAPPKRGKGQTKGAVAEEKRPLKHSGYPDMTPAENLKAWENYAKTEARILGENMVMLQNDVGDVTFYGEDDKEAIERVESKGFKKMSLVRPDGTVKNHQTNNPAAGYEVEVDVPEGTKPPKTPTPKDDDDDIDDAAPRTLTGDTRLRLSQVQDRVYKIGEISQKTGLMKTEHGWVKPKNGAPKGTKNSEQSASSEGKGKTYTFTKAGHVYNVPASSPAEAVQKLKSRGVKGFKESDAFDDSTPRQAAGSEKSAENKGMEEKKYQDRKKAQQVEAARQNKNNRDFYDNTGLKGRGGPGEALARNEADKEDRKQDNLKAGKRDDSMFQKNDKIEFNRAGHYINGSIKKVDKDWQGNVSLYVRGEDGKGYWVETNNVTKHEGAN